MVERKQKSIGKLLKQGFVYGAIFAGIMAAFDYFDHQPFNFGKFIFYLIPMGLFYSLAFRFDYVTWNDLKQKKKE
jgi:hypothetical protein